MGERLRKVREEAGVTLQEAADDTSIRLAYLEALENGNFQDLPGPVYIENFLKRYAEYLKVSPDFVIDLYKHQVQKAVKNKYRTKWPLSDSRPRAIITPRILKLVGIGLIVLIGLGYIGFEVMRIFSPPQLSVSNPADNLTVSTVTVPVTGSTEPDITLTVNGKQIYVDEAGDFSEVVSLQAGLNVITVSAVKKRSKPTVITRRILLDTDQPQIQTNL